MPQDTFQQARERYDDAKEAWRENYERMREDLRFSNPADPKQWADKTLEDRKGRVTLTLDQTNQFIQQVSNDARLNTPAIHVTPGDDEASLVVAQEQAKRIRYLEYKSRAGTAYDTALEGGARIGLGWIRVVPVIVDEKRDIQEPRILTIHDWLSVLLDGDSVAWDGSDAEFGFAEETISERVFKRRYPGAKIASFGESDGWFSDKGVRIAEYLAVEIERGNKITTGNPDGTDQVDMTEEEYWRVAGATGVKPHVISTDPHAELDRRVVWRKLSGCEVLEETEFPSKYLGIVPVYGHMVWVDGKRYVSGLTRRLMDGQRFHNYQMSALAETLLEQPKAPFMAAARAIKGHENHWSALNKGNPAYLVFNDVPDNDDEPPIAPPQRMGPPPFPAANAQAAQMGVQSMMAAVGMNKSVLGQQSNAVSGRAKQADKIEGDTATFHYVDNQRRSIEFVGRILLDMEARLTVRARTLRTLGMDDKPGTVRVDPTLKGPTLERDGKLVAINPAIGTYDTRVQAGPGYTTVREEMKDRLVQLGQTNPALAAAITPLLVKLDDLPESETLMRVCMAMLPPPVQQAYKEADGEAPPIPPAVQAQMRDMQAKLEQAGALVQQLAQQLETVQQEATQATAEADNKAKELAIKNREADAKVMSAEADLIRARTEAGQGLAEVVAALQSDLQRTRDQVAQVLGV